jgi:hypothetical protein
MAALVRFINLRRLTLDHALLFDMLLSQAGFVTIAW